MLILGSAIGYYGAQTQDVTEENKSGRTLRRACVRIGSEQSAD